MSVRVDPATLSGLASGLERSTSDLGRSQPPSNPDLGPSSAVGMATVSAVLRATAGYVDTLHRGAADLDANKADYTSTDDDSAGLFHNLGH